MNIIGIIRNNILVLAGFVIAIGLLGWYGLLVFMVTLLVLVIVRKFYMNKVAH